MRWTPDATLNGWLDPTLSLRTNHAVKAKARRIRRRIGGGRTVVRPGKPVGFSSRRERADPGVRPAQEVRAVLHAIIPTAHRLPNQFHGAATGKRPKLNDGVRARLGSLNQP